MKKNINRMDFHTYTEWNNSNFNQINKLVIATSYPERIDKSDGISLHYLYVQNKIANSYEESRYYWSKEEMLNCFSYIDNIEEIVIHNPKKLADKIDNIELENDELGAQDNYEKNKFKEFVLKKADKYYANKIPKDIKKILDNELEYIEKNNLEEVIYMIENILHYDQKYNGTTYLGGDLKDSLVLYLLGLTNKLDSNYKIDSKNGKTHEITLYVDELFIEDIKNYFLCLHQKNLCYYTNKLYIYPSKNDIKNSLNKLTTAEVKKIEEDLTGIYNGQEKYVFDNQFAFLPENSDIWKLLSFQKVKDYDLPVACVDMTDYCNVIIFDTFNFNEKGY